MTLGNLLASKRKMANLTQQQVGDALNVSPQAVSKWENDLAQPDLASLKRLAELYGVPVSQLIDAADEEKTPEEPAPEPAPEPTPAPQPSVTYIEVPQKPVLAVCEDCNKPLYEGKDIVRGVAYHGKTSVPYVICAKCNQKRKKSTAYSLLNEAQKAKRLAITLGIIFALIVGIGLFFVPQIRFWSILLGFCTFCLTSCVVIDESFVGEMWQTMISWSFHAPGVIFTLDLDGLTWLIAVKLLFWILGAIFAVLAFLFGTAVGFVFAPFAAIYDYVQNAKEIKEQRDVIAKADAFIKAN